MTIIDSSVVSLPQNDILKKIAFTLAEVLITLGIIGVVAAMTIPTLMTKIQHKQYSARLKKFYSTMKQMNISAEEEFGDIADWDKTLTPKEYLERYFAPFLKGSIRETAGDVYFYFLDGSTFHLQTSGHCTDILYDVNGLSKPNKWGYDTFMFLYCPAQYPSYCDGKERFCPYSTKFYYNSRAGLLSRCKNGEAGNSVPAGGFCAALLKYDNWEFKDDYPWK